MERVACRRPAVLLPGGTEALMVDVSADGCRLRLASAAPAADPCVIVDLEAGTAYQARLVWRLGEQAGFRFLRRASLKGVVSAAFVDAKALWRGRKAAAEAPDR